jgi:amidohydrolase
MLGVDVIYSMHVDPTLSVGIVGIRDGVLTAGCDEISFTIRGTGGHAARPHLARDPISAAADLIHALYLHIPRVTDSQEAVVLTIGQIRGGHSFNVIPDTVQLNGTIRTLERSVRDTSIDHISRIARAIGVLTETEISVVLGLSAPPVVNHHRESKRLQTICEDMLGPDAIHTILRPSMGSEDFAYYVQNTPGCMVRLGCTSEARGGHGLHTPLFDVDEEVIRIGVRLMTRAVIESCSP